ncbi:MAG: Arylsulfatase [Verrucomicrobia subdivision 3 bacterium]|nr:Arylsulfatase [Limisphaerales bacterium]MCS1412548.1 Arylsulfatase [Limisphaerales bacterium]
MVMGLLLGARAGLAERPNIVLIIADDMNWNDCGAYGNPVVRTPNIDRLAAEGMRFRHAYLTANSCSPSRASIITGRYPHNTGAEQLHWPLPSASVTFVEKLKRAGYYAAAAGKWHLGEGVKDRFDDVFEASMAGFILPAGDGKEPPKMIAKAPSGCEAWLPTLRNRPRDRPFFLWLAALDPHREYEDGALNPPHEAEEVLVPPHLPDTPEVREDLRLYYDEIGRLDQYVGQVVAELDRQGVSDNTAILFITDNGRPFPRDKTSLYDGGIRTPWIVKWPARVRAGSVSESLVSAVDIASTFLDMAGLPSVSTFVGVSILPVLDDPTVSVRDYVFAEDHWHDYEDHGRAVGNQRYKLIRNDYPDLAATPSADVGRSLTWQRMLTLRGKGGLTFVQEACFVRPRPEWELYDLLNDPHELRNIVDVPQLQSLVTTLKRELTEWEKRTGDYLPTVRTPDEFDRATGKPDHSVRVRPRQSKHEMFGTYGPY